MRVGNRDHDYQISLALLKLEPEESHALGKVFRDAIAILGLEGATRVLEQMVFAFRDAHLEDKIEPRASILSGITHYTQTLLNYGQAGHHSCVPRDRLEAIQREYAAYRPTEHPADAAERYEIELALA